MTRPQPGQTALPLPGDSGITYSFLPPLELERPQTLSPSNNIHVSYSPRFSSSPKASLFPQNHKLSDATLSPLQPASSPAYEPSFDMSGMLNSIKRTEVEVAEFLATSQREPASHQLARLLFQEHNVMGSFDLSLDSAALFGDLSSPSNYPSRVPDHDLTQRRFEQPTRLQPEPASFHDLLSTNSLHSIQPLGTNFDSIDFGLGNHSDLQFDAPVGVNIIPPSGILTGDFSQGGGDLSRPRSRSLGMLKISTHFAGLCLDGSFGSPGNSPFDSRDSIEGGFFAPWGDLADQQHGAPRNTLLFAPNDGPSHLGTHADPFFSAPASPTLPFSPLDPYACADNLLDSAQPRSPAMSPRLCSPSHMSPYPGHMPQRRLSTGSLVMRRTSSHESLYGGPPVDPHTGRVIKLPRELRRCLWPGGCNINGREHKTQWRTGPKGPATLCNKHGLQFKYPGEKEKRNEHRRKQYKYRKVGKDETEN